MAADCIPQVTFKFYNHLNPLICAVPFTDVEEVLPAVNNSIYGLAAVVWTRNIG